VKIKDPTAWIEDLSVHIDDEDMSGMVEQFESTAMFSGSKIGVGLLVAISGAIGGAFGAVTLSPEIRASLPGFVLYLAGAVIVLRGLRPITLRFLGPGIPFIAGMALFFTFLLGLLVAIGGRVESTWLAYGLAVGGGLFIGMVYFANQPDFIRNEEAWFSAGFLLTPTGAVLGTWLLRGPLDGSGSALDMGMAGAVAGATLMAPMGFLMVRLWNVAQGLYRMGLLLLHNENFAPRAVAYFDRAIALTPDDARLWNLRGIAWSKMNEPERARADWAKVAELEPNDPEPHLNRGADALRQGDLDHAIECFNMVIELQPDHAKAYSNRGAALERRGDLEAAIASYDRAIEIDPEYVNALSNRAYARYRAGDHQGAIEDCDRAIDLAPDFANAYVNRAEALTAIGDLDAAEQSYRHALTLQPQPEIVEEAVRGLEKVAGRRAAAV
jgi:Flp pilus assembly protein TadD